MCVLFQFKASSSTCLSTQAGSSGKPAAAINKMVEGRLGKYFEECVLMEQRFVLDDRMTVREVVDR